MDKKIIEQLNGLKSVKPDFAWKEANRSLLLSQISYSEDVQEEKSKYGIFDFSFLRNVPQPVMATFMIVAVLFGASALSLHASKNALPGDSLYIAKKINEKTKFAFTFGEEKKARLGLEFAGERVREIKEVMQTQETDEKQERVDKLVDDFKKEIQVAKARLTNTKTISSEEFGAIEDSGEINEEDTMVFSAGLEKDQKGLEMAEVENEVEASTSLEKIIIDKLTSSSSTEITVDSDLAIDASSTEEKASAFSIDELVSQTKELVTKDSIDPKVLEELETAIDQLTVSEKGEVKGENEENATSSENYIEVEVESDEIASSSEG